MNDLEKTVKILLCLLLGFLLCGCWDRRELESLRIVSAIGFDLTEKEQYRVTVQLIVSSPPGEQANSESATKLSINSATGVSPLTAIRNLSHTAARRFFWSDNKVIIIGETLAQKGITPVIDLWLRDHQPRLRNQLLVAEGEAKTFLEDESKTEKIVAKKYEDIIENQERTSTLTKTDVKNYIVQANSPGKIALVPKISFASSQHKYEVKGKEKVVIIEGAAVFKNNKLVGWLNEQETRGREFVQKNVKGGIITVALSEKQEDFVDLEILKADSKIIIDWLERQPVITVKIKTISYLNEQSTEKDLSKPEILERINQLYANKIREEITTSLAKARQLNTDYFGFSTHIYQRHPKLWNQIKSDWERVFATMPVEVNVESEIKRTGTIHGSPLKSKD